MQQIAELLAVRYSHVLITKQSSTVVASAYYKLRVGMRNVPAPKFGSGRDLIRTLVSPQAFKAAVSAANVGAGTLQGMVLLNLERGGEMGAGQQHLVTTCD